MSATQADDGTGGDSSQRLVQRPCEKRVYNVDDWPVADGVQSQAGAVQFRVCVLRDFYNKGNYGIESTVASAPTDATTAPTAADGGILR